MKIADLTRLMTPDMPVFPGDALPKFRRTADYVPDGYREMELNFLTHTGSHADAPAHVIPGGRTIDMMPAECFCGTAAVFRVPEGTRNITARMLAECAGAEKADFLLISTGWERYWGSPEYFSGYPVLDESAARRLVSARKKGIGFDVMSPDPVGSADLPLHRILLGGGLVILENLCGLADLPDTVFQFCALPLKVENADGAPVRALVFL
ncbi:MAG: cyclase family protein [Pyramidobacter sp.]